ncbi:MAG: DUF523 domain-containing protein [Clostridia bacterium]|nr:DUF523 domain-containing protein [Clostridia bacterium]
MKEKLLVSACLLGTPCRYDGKSKPSEKVLSLKEKFDLVPICPEVSGGLPIPRLPCELYNGKVLRKDGEDMTFFYEKGAQIALQLARENNCSIAILKEKSPSCSPHLHYDGTFSGTLTPGMGITAKLLSQNGIRVLGEDETDQI